MIDDIRNDTTRLSQFFETAGRVMDIDQKQQKSLANVSGLDKKEWINAKRRIRENAHVVEIVYQSLSDRVASYHFALETPGHCHAGDTSGRSGTSAQSAAEPD